MTIKEIIAPFFFLIKIAWGKFQERDMCFSLVRNRSLRMVCSTQHHLITIFKQQIIGLGRTFHSGERGDGVLRQFLTRFTNQASFGRT